MLLPILLILRFVKWRGLFASELFGIGTYHYHDRKNLGNLYSLQILPVYFATTTCSMYSSRFLVTGSFSKVQSQELFRMKNLYPVLSSLRSH